MNRWAVVGGGEIDDVAGDANMALYIYIWNIWLIYREYMVNL